jgi:hypothetical protein
MRHPNRHHPGTMLVACACGLSWSATSCGDSFLDRECESGKSREPRSRRDAHRSVSLPIGRSSAAFADETTAPQPDAATGDKGIANAAPGPSDAPATHSQFSQGARVCTASAAVGAIAGVSSTARHGSGCCRFFATMRAAFSVRQGENRNRAKYDSDRSRSGDNANSRVHLFLSIGFGDWRLSGRAERSRDG